MELAFRLLHVLSAVIFFGGLIPVHFLYPVALRQSDRGARVGALRVVLLASRVFLSPGSILLLITGFGLAGTAHASLRQPWLLAAVVLYLLAAIPTMAILPRHGRAVLKAAEEAAKNPTAPDPVPAVAANPLAAAVRMFSFIAAWIILGLMVWHSR